MQPPERDFAAPDPNLNGSQNPPPLPPTPPVFEAAPAPHNSLPPAPYPPIPPTGLEAPVYRPGLEPPPLPLPLTPPLPLLSAPLSTVGDFSHRIARWRWALALLIVGFYPLFVSLLGRLRPDRSSSGPALPASARGLIIYCLLELAVFGVFWALGWAFSRATKDELLLRWRGGFKPILQGFGYALALRLGLVVVIVFAATLFLTATGTDPKQFAEFMKQNQPQTDSLFPKGALKNPLYLFLMTTLLSFVVAGLREELWRNATLAALRHLLPDHWGENARWITAIVLSSVVFGLGHLYQGGLGVVFTALLGAGLGVVTWRHRSIWPAVFAHGFIDATSFLAAAAMAGKKVPIQAFWFGG